jgi:hypothetical protein
MARRTSATWLAGCWLLIASQALAQSPPAGGSTPVQTTMTGDYWITATDLSTIIPVSCAAPCSFSLPTIDASTPRAVPLTLIDLGPAPVTVSSASPITGPLVSPAGTIALAHLGDWIKVQALSAGAWEATGIVQ